MRGLGLGWCREEIFVLPARRKEIRPKDTSPFSLSLKANYLESVAGLGGEADRSREQQRERRSGVRRSFRERLSRSLSASFDGKSYEVFVDFDDEVI